MNFCPKCGSNINENQKFCSKCGYNLNRDFSNEQSNNQSNNTANNKILNDNAKGITINYKSMSKNKKYGLIASLVAIILVSVFFVLGKSQSKPSKVVQNFEQAVKTGDNKKLVRLLYVSDKNLKLDDKNVEPLSKYLKDNPIYTRDLIKKLEKQAFLLGTNNALYSIAQDNSSEIFTIKKVGNKFLFFPNYKIVVNPVYININTKVKDVVFTMDGKEMGKSDMDNFQKQYGPFLPGIHKITATYKGKYANLNESYDINTIDSNEIDEKGRITVYLLNNVKYMNFDSDFQDAEIYVNNQSTGVKVQDAKMFGPLNAGTKVYAKTNKNGKDLISDEYIVDDSENTQVYLSFENALYNLERIEEEITDLMESYTAALCGAVNYNDFSYLESFLYPGSPIYEMQKEYVPNAYNKGIREYIKSLNILSYSMSEDNKTGTVTTEERYEIYNANNEESIKVFKYTYTFRFNELNQRYQIESIKQAN